MMLTKILLDASLGDYQQFQAYTDKTKHKTIRSFYDKQTQTIKKRGWRYE